MTNAGLESTEKFANKVESSAEAVLSNIRGNEQGMEDDLSWARKINEKDQLELERIKNMEGMEEDILELAEEVSRFLNSVTPNSENGRALHDIKDNLNKGRKSPLRKLKSGLANIDEELEEVITDLKDLIEAVDRELDRVEGQDELDSAIRQELRNTEEMFESLKQTVKGLEQNKARFNRQETRVIEDLDQKVSAIESILEEAREEEEGFGEVEEETVEELVLDVKQLEDETSNVVKDLEELEELLDDNGTGSLVSSRDLVVELKENMGSGRTLGTTKQLLDQCIKLVQDIEEKRSVLAKLSDQEDNELQRLKTDFEGVL